MIQINVDATRMSQAFTGSRYIQSIINGEVNAFLQGYRAKAAPPVDLALRARFNPALNQMWFGAVMQVINGVTMLLIILTGAALIREREHGTVEHLLVMPVTPFEIMMSKIWAMALLVLAVSLFSLIVVVQGPPCFPFPWHAFAKPLERWHETELQGSRVRRRSDNDITNGQDTGRGELIHGRGSYKGRNGRLQ